MSKQTVQPTPPVPPASVAPVTPVAPQTPVHYQNNENPGDTLAVVGIVLCFLQLSLVGLFFSIFGYKKSKEAGRSTTFGTLGIALNAISVAIGLLVFFFYLMVLSSMLPSILSSGSSIYY